MHGLSIKFILREAFTIMLSLSFFTIYSQPNIEEVFPPSPTASEFVKQINFPTNNYTGVPEINIPLWTLKSKTLSVPISLSYHASGIKVDQMAGWTGLGWTLFAGGQITREVRGKPDDISDYGYMACRKNIVPNIQDWFDSFSCYDKRLIVETNQYDFEPDIYSFSFPGGSGMFIYNYKSTDTDNEYSTIPYQLIKIKSKSDNGVKLAEWEITDQNGIVYYFKDCDVNENHANNANYITTWYLNKIKDPIHNDSIVFTYEPIIESFDIQRSSTKYLCNDIGCNLGDNEQPLVAFYINGFKLKSIETSLTRINFNNQLEREDYKDNKGTLLNSIDILNRIDPTQKISYKFDYTMVTSTSNIGVVGYQYIGEYLKKRAFLDSLIISVPGIGEKQKYVFEYENRKSLPPRNSFAQDTWGYYNGKNNNTLIPSMLIQYTGEELMYNFIGADKTPNLGYTKAGTLMKITWPTKGFTQYEYDLHDYGYIGSTALPNSDTEDHLITKAITMVYHANGTLRSFTAPNLKIEKDQFVEVRAEFPPLNGQQNIWYNVTNIATGNNVTIEDHTTSIYLPKGEYQIAWEKNFIPIEDSYSDIPMKLDITYTIYQEILIEGKSVVGEIAGGLRIRKIDNYDGLSQKTTSKYFEYTMPGLIMIDNYNVLSQSEIATNNDNRSSGVLVNCPPIYKATYTEGVASLLYDCNYTVLHSKSVNSIGLSGGSHVVYRNVTIYDEKKSYNNTHLIELGMEPKPDSYKNGKEVYSYITPFEFPDNLSNTYPPLPGGKNEWERGMLKSLSIYDSLNNLIKQENYVYKTSHLFEARGHIIVFTIKEKSACTGTNLTNDVYKIESYDLNSGWKYLESTTNNEYFYNASGLTSNLETITSYTYDDQTTLLESKTVRTSQTGKFGLSVSEENEYAYKNDPLFSNNFLYSAKSKITKKVNSTISEGIKINYTGLLPTSVEKLINGTYQPEISFRYNDDKRLKEYQKTDGIPVSILWGYQSQFPVAEIKGLSYENAISPFSPDELNLMNTLLLSDDAMRTLLGKFYLPQWPFYNKAFVKTFTYNPLKGMTSSTDENGKTTYYNYDGFGRLSDIHYLNNLIQTYDYHYKE